MKVEIINYLNRYLIKHLEVIKLTCVSLFNKDDIDIQSLPKLELLPNLYLEYRFLNIDGMLTMLVTTNDIGLDNVEITNIKFDNTFGEVIRSGSYKFVELLPNALLSDMSYYIKRK